ncbi:hypothetical protein FHS18_004026 [Paenibacillus phyllosphaerae]|uniref:Colicin E3-like ribonuclease domain-containing protein n=1 Tax=Paenibacillus phyllosphaerae TaxID=274593 RepID=A0A7W5FP79_9BACL|nr:colicin E3/pyocin S6 family cytotoxin [Paenibacillus phyllosphaerae]MBB3111958.1 hypothetical protein [Paenibacillus phyllosphaerae]
MKKDWRLIPAGQYPVLMPLEPTSYFWKKERIYRDAERFYHKDALHGEVEVYDKRGRHIGVMTPEGDWHPKKQAVKGRKITI